MAASALLFLSNSLQFSVSFLDIAQRSTSVCLLSSFVVLDAKSYAVKCIECIAQAIVWFHAPPLAPFLVLQKLLRGLQRIA